MRMNKSNETNSEKKPIEEKSNHHKCHSHSSSSSGLSQEFKEGIKKIKQAFNEKNKLRINSKDSNQRRSSNASETMDLNQEEKLSKQEQIEKIRKQ